MEIESTITYDIGVDCFILHERRKEMSSGRILEHQDLEELQKIFNRVDLKNLTREQYLKLGCPVLKE